MITINIPIEEFVRDRDGGWSMKFEKHESTSIGKLESNYRKKIRNLYK